MRNGISFLSTLWICLLLVFGGATTASAQYTQYQVNHSDDFLKAFEWVTERMLGNYQQHVPERVFAEVLIETKNTNDFLKSIFPNSRTLSESHPLSLMYLPQSRVNGIEGSTCFIRYDPNNRHALLNGYDLIMDKAETVYYLAVHEFGHCMIFHQALIHTKTKPDLTLNEHELFADKIAIAFFATNNQPETVEKILYFNKTHVSKDSRHYQGDALAKYYDRLTSFLATSEINDEVKSMLDLYHLAQL